MLVTQALAFSQKRSQCMLGSFGGTKYMPYGDRRQICERVEVSTIKYQLFRRDQKSNISFLHFTFIILKTLFEQMSFITRKSEKATLHNDN